VRQGRGRAISRGSWRCRHGFATGKNCEECAQAAVAPVIARHAEELAEHRASIVCCALCRDIGHVSKLCPQTEVGKARLARITEAAT
jgi:hypothetical protein